MDKKKVTVWISELIENFKRHESLSVSMEDTCGIRACKLHYIQLISGIRKIIDLLEAEYKEEIFNLNGKKHLRISFIYGGVEFVELDDMQEDCDAGDA